jgi:hypothetical protein
MEGRESLPLRQLALVWLLVIVLAALAFSIVFFIWRPALEMLLFTVLDRFVARAVYMLLFVGMMIAVALTAAFGEPLLERAMRRGRHWATFLRVAGGLLVFGVIGLIITTVVSQFAVP